eukprot:5478547-Prymnesium_polylepis.1
MSGRTATWKQPVYSTFVLTVNGQVGLLTNGLHSAVRTRTAYQSLTCGEAPFSCVREEIVPECAAGPNPRRCWQRRSR